MKKITVMYDYAADGLWIEGRAISWNHLIEKYNFPENFKIIGYAIDEWQKMYNSIFLTVDDDIDYDAEKFKQFNELGQKIFRAIVKFVVAFDLPFEVEYFDEKTSKYYFLENNELKEKDGTSI